MTDNGLKHLNGIHTLVIGKGSHHITPMCLSHLKGVHYLLIENGEMLADQGLDEIQRRIHILALRRCHHLTEAGLRKLKGINILVIGNCRNITTPIIENMRGRIRDDDFNSEIIDENVPKQKENHIFLKTCTLILFCINCKITVNLGDLIKDVTILD